MDLLKIIETLQSKISHLENKTQTNFREFLETANYRMDSDLMEIIQQVGSQKPDCVFSAGKHIYVFEDKWIFFKDIPNEYLEKWIHEIQRNQILSLPKDEEYTKNLFKITSIDVKKWVKKNKSKIAKCFT